MHKYANTNLDIPDKLSLVYECGHLDKPEKRIHIADFILNIIERLLNMEKSCLEYPGKESCYKRLL